MTLVAASPNEEARTRAADVLGRLHADIVTCRLKPGEPLRFEPLKEAYGASFTTLREALTALTADGLVVSEGQRGFHVAPVSRSDLVDLTEARVLIERRLLELAIANGGDEWAVATTAALHRMTLAEQRLAPQYALTVEWKALHRQFHEALVAAAGSPILLGIRANLFARAERYRSLSSTYRRFKRDKAGEHKAILDAALARKPDKALALIDRHFRSTAEAVLECAHKFLDAGRDGVRPLSSSVSTIAKPQAKGG
jgi:GntR family transcriptional regulator, carbon starvation induced regulator